MFSSVHSSVFKLFSLLTLEFPYGQLPVLEVDGTLIGQSMAILRYLSKKYGKYAAFYVPLFLRISYFGVATAHPNDAFCVGIKSS